MREKAKKMLATIGGFWRKRRCRSRLFTVQYYIILLTAKPNCSALALFLVEFLWLWVLKSVKPASPFYQRKNSFELLPCIALFNWIELIIYRYFYSIFAKLEPVLIHTNKIFYRVIGNFIWLINLPVWSSAS